MHKKLWILMLASAVAVSALATAACSSDNSVGSSGGINDGGNPDGSNVNDGGDGGVDGGPCTFAGFVQGLLKQPANSAPSTDLGDSCTPSTSQDDFAPVFTQHH